MHLAIDIGNTRIKAALFDGARQQQAYQLSHWSALLAVADEHSVTRAIVSSVGPLRAVQALGRRLPIPLLVLDSATPLPFAEAYESLGADRRAAVAEPSSNTPSATPW